jgi:hypothetical protein
MILMRKRSMICLLQRQHLFRFPLLQLLLLPLLLQHQLPQ